LASRNSTSIQYTTQVDERPSNIATGEDDVMTAEKEQTIWRYMDFRKLYHLVTSQVLFLPSIHCLRETDPFEGMPTAAFYRMMDELAAKQMLDLQLAHDDLSALMGDDPEIQESLRELSKTMSYMRQPNASDLPLGDRAPVQTAKAQKARFHVKQLGVIGVKETPLWTSSTTFSARTTGSSTSFFPGCAAS